MANYDFSGWATRNDLLCGDGRTIRKDAFKDQDGTEVPLIYNHKHDDVNAVLGHALLENRPEGVYAYGTFNDSDAGRAMKTAVAHGDVRSLSIYANKLKQIGGDVVHGNIRELSLVLAGANPGAYIDFVMAHGEDGDEITGFEASWDENIVIYHSDDSSESNDEAKEDDKEMATSNTKTDETEKTEKSDNTAKSEEKKDTKEKTVQDVIDTMNEEQKNVMMALLDEALAAKPKEDEEDDKNKDNNGGKEMKHNVFENDVKDNGATLSHSDQQAIMALAKSSSVGSFQEALSIYAEQNELAHGAIDGEVLGKLLPDYKDVYPGEPETLTDDQTWIGTVISGVHKSPVSRVRTRQLDARNRKNRAHGYKKGVKKLEGTNVALLTRTTDPQTIYIKDKLNRDDIIDFTEFDMVGYQWKVMVNTLNEELATAIMIGDGREEGAEDKISETHIRSIWNDDELYTIHKDVDLAAAKKKLQGTNTDAYFGDNYVYAEAIIEAALYAREEYKGSGNLKFFCTPHLLNVMLLARDMNGRRIYSSKADLQAALNVTSIETVEQFEGLVRTDKALKQHELLGIFVNLTDYQVGSTKGGEITKFEQFDIDFNQQKLLIETRVSGALTRVKSAIVLEMPVASDEVVSG